MSSGFPTLFPAVLPHGHSNEYRAVVHGGGVPTGEQDKCMCVCVCLCLHDTHTHTCTLSGLV